MAPNCPVAAAARALATTQPAKGRRLVAGLCASSAANCGLQPSQLQPSSGERVCNTPSDEIAAALASTGFCNFIASVGGHSAGHGFNDCKASPGSQELPGYFIKARQFYQNQWLFAFELLQNYYGGAPPRAAARARASRRWRRQTSRIPEKFVFSCQTASGVSQPLDSLGFGKKQLNAPGKTGKFHPAELVTTCHRFAVEQWID